MSYHLVRPSSLQPIIEPRNKIEWESKGLFNPTVQYVNDEHVMYYRTFPEEVTKFFDNESGRYRLQNQTSLIGRATSPDGINFRLESNPWLAGDVEYETGGVEDPRLSIIGNKQYVTYTAIKGAISGEKNNPEIRIAIAEVVGGQPKKMGRLPGGLHSKAGALFKSGEKTYFIYTQNPDRTNSVIKVVEIDSVDELVSSSEWINRSITLLASSDLHHRGPELGAVPILTKYGWLLIFSNESMGRQWTVGAAILDVDNPTKLLARTSGRILEPVLDWELMGNVPCVTFPSGAVVKGDQLIVYYGAADTVVGMALGSLEKLVESMESVK